ALANHFRFLRKSLFWFEDGRKSYAMEDHSPVFLYERGEHTFYGFPSLNDRGVKIGDHSGGRKMRSPKRLKRGIDRKELDESRRFLQEHLPELGTRLTHHTTCMYTMSPDGHFLVGRYPDSERVHLAAGLSGHGFKFASVLGEVLADLTIDGETRHPIDFLNPSRLD
ncbi:MAG: FAD-dependent oxidoreductase, partial [Pseudomonadales bacterium]|nr:FAD-dependent oxidoreductase [Pseudomonadales bacterium]